jgi:PucR-like helix-turn-helix protein/purine catabolism regulatory family protein/diguanylate cyclase with GGDEF domain
VDGVQSTEIADVSAYLSGGEFVLTTGMWRSATGDADSFVGVLRSAGASALGYAISVAGSSVPDDVVAACESQGLCLIEIPLEMPFAAISKAFVEWQSAEREAWLLNALKRSQAMTRAIADGGGLASLLSILARDTGIESAVVTSTGETLAKSSRGVTARMIESVAHAFRTQGQGGDAVSPADPQPLALELADPLGGNALLLCFPREELANESRQAIDQTIAHVGVYLARRGAIRATELRFAGELLELIAGGPGRLREINERLTAFGIDPSESLGVLALSSDHDKSTELEISILDRTVRELGLPAIVLARATEHMLFVQVESSEQLREAADTVLGHLRLHPRVSGAAVGLGQVIPNAMHLATAVAEARQTRFLAESDPEPYSLATPERGGSHELLLAVAGDDALAALARGLIMPIREHDAQHHSDLVHTLSTFLESSGQWKRTAEELHIHVNTLRNRISRIETITGRDMSTMAARVDFYLALKAEH